MRPGNAVFSDSKLFLPIITGIPHVLFLKYLKSLGRLHGRLLFIPITLFSDAATIWESMVDIFIDSYYIYFCACGNLLQQAVILPGNEVVYQSTVLTEYLNSNRSFNCRMTLIIQELEIRIRKIENIFYRRVYSHFRKWERLPCKLESGLLKMI